MAQRRILPRSSAGFHISSTQKQQTSAASVGHSPCKSCKKYGRRALSCNRRGATKNRQHFYFVTIARRMGSPETSTMAACPTPALTSCQSTRCVLSRPSRKPLIVAKGPRCQMWKQSFKAPDQTKDQTKTEKRHMWKQSFNAPDQTKTKHRCGNRRSKRLIKQRSQMWKQSFKAPHQTNIKQNTKNSPHGWHSTLVREPIRA